MSGETGSDIQAVAAARLQAPWGEMAAPAVPNADEKLWGMLVNVLGLVFLIGPIAVLLMKGSSKFVKFYAMQMICWSLVGIALSIVLGVVFRVLIAVPVVGVLVINVLSPLLSLVFLGLLIFLALKAHGGVVYRLPFIGQFAYSKAYEA